jgi:hypothetical protein
MYFIWINGLRGPEAQLWVSDSVDGSGKSKPVLFKKKLSIIDQVLSLDRLKEKYPLCAPIK